MPRKMVLIVGLCIVASSPAVADIIDVTVNGTVSGSGTAIIDCGYPPPPGSDCTPAIDGLVPPTETVSYNFKGGASDSGSATSTVAPGFIEGQASQDITVTDDSISILLSAGHTVAIGELLTFFGTESNDVTVDFDLTSPSEATLSGGGFTDPLCVCPDAGELLDSDGNVILTAPNTGFPVSVLLQPGSYELSTGAQAFPSGDLAAAEGTFTDLQWALDASFAPVPTPEPRGALFAALFLGLLVAGFVSRRRAA